MDSKVSIKETPYVTEADLLEIDAFRRLADLPLKTNDYVIMGSGIMFALGIRDLKDLDDLDIFVSPSAWEKVKGMANIKHDDAWNCDHISLFDGKIEIYNGWGPSNYDIEGLLNSAFTIGQFNFLHLAILVAWKREMGREKDKKHIQMIEEFFGNGPRPTF